MDADPLEAARAEADARSAELAEHMAVSDAERTVASARVHDLAAETAKAYRRIAAARGRVTRALKDGDAGKIQAAHEHLAMVRREFDRISHANIAEMFTLNRAGLDRIDETFKGMARANEAHDRVMDALNARREPRN